MTQHTQGEWYVERSEGRLTIWMEGGAGKVKQRHICDIPHDDLQDQANARLIAATPKLLVALKKSLPLLELTGSWSEAQKIKSLISEAEGE